MVFGDTNLELSLLVSDKALLNLVRLVTRALNEVIHARGKPNLVGHPPH